MINLDERIIQENRHLLKKGAGLKEYDEMPFNYFKDEITRLSNFTENHIRSAYQAFVPIYAHYGPCLGFLAQEVNVDCLSSLYGIFKKQITIDDIPKTNDDRILKNYGIEDLSIYFEYFEENSKIYEEEATIIMMDLFESCPNTYDVILKLWKRGKKSFFENLSQFSLLHRTAEPITQIFENDLATTLTSMYLEMEVSFYGYSPTSQLHSSQDFWVYQ